MAIFYEMQKVKNLGFLSLKAYYKQRVKLRHLQWYKPFGQEKRKNKHCGVDPNERTLGFGSDQLTNLHELTYHQTKFE